MGVEMCCAIFFLPCYIARGRLGLREVTNAAVHKVMDGQTRQLSCFSVLYFHRLFSIAVLSHLHNEPVHQFIGLTNETLSLLFYLLFSCMFSPMYPPELVSVSRSIFFLLVKCLQQEEEVGLIPGFREAQTG